MSEPAPISGVALPPFEGVREAFAQNFADGAEDGASFAVFVDGELIVNLFGGWTDRKQSAVWESERLACIYSCGKLAMAMLVAKAVSEGAISYDAPVAEVWPAFGAAGKEDITLAEVMSHQAGLVGFAEPIDPPEWLDWDAITARIETMAPLFEPRSASGYSPQLVGFVVGEALRRTTGKTVGAQLAALRASDGLGIYCGLPEAAATRTVAMRKPPAAPHLGTITELKEIAFLKPWSAPGKVSREAWMAAEIPASNMHSDARSLAAIAQPFASRGRWIDGSEMLTGDAIEQALGERIRGDDLVLPFDLSWAAGPMRNVNRHFGPNPSAYGHAGSGGSCVMFDPENRISAAYVMNRMSPHLVGDPRASRLIDAVYAAL